MSNVKAVAEAEFGREVIESKETVLVDFSASWCMPCKHLEPVLEKVAEESIGKVKVVKIDIDDAPTLTKQFGIRSVPTLIVFENGKVRNTQVGRVSKETILKMFA